MSKILRLPSVLGEHQKAPLCLVSACLSGLEWPIGVESEFPRGLQIWSVIVGLDSNVGLCSHSECQGWGNLAWLQAAKCSIAWTFIDSSMDLHNNGVKSCIEHHALAAGSMWGAGKRVIT
jgi:hypothetical protein